MFWQAMDRLPTSAVAPIERELWGTILEQHSVPLDMLVYDTTNFYSYLAEQTPSELNKKGHNKASRHHLRQVGMSLSVIRGLGLPLIHELYEGSENDATLFPTAISRTIDRVREVSGGKVENLTVVFDKGNNSTGNIGELGNQQVNFIGTLSPSHFPALCSIRLSRFTELETENGSQELIFDTHAKAFDRLLRVVVTYNAKTARKQEKRFQKNLGKTLAELAQVRWATVKDPEAKIREVVNPRLIAFLFSVQGEGADLTVRLDHSAVKAYRKRFGKNLIFTDREDLPAEDVVQAYRDRNEVEQVFGEMNDPETVPFQPVRHWTDQKIVIHAFICILGLLLFKLLQLKLKRQGITLSLAILKDELDPIHLQLFVSRSGKLFKIISDRSKLQANMFDLFSLQKIVLALGAQHDSS